MMRKTAWLFAALAVLAFAVSGAALAADKPELTVDDCAKCHDGPPADIAAAGAKHKTEIGCTDCHGGHRPASAKNIPPCSDCHDGGDHYSLKGCLGCHTNPHKPLEIALGGKVTDPCLSCHKEQIVQLKENPSKHSALFCTQCHNVHRKIPACVDCHKPHGSQMTQADCAKCHKAHQLANVVYGMEVPNQDCGACHATAAAKLAATPFKHKDVSCVACHKAQHKMVPTCDSCHPDKHDPLIKKRFPKCGMCHYIAHDLNNFPESAPGPAGAPKKKP